MPRSGMDIVNEIRREQSAPPAQKVARIVVTSTGEDPPPFFLVVDNGAIRKQFIDDTIQMVFGRQPDGEPHTWERSEGGQQTDDGRRSAVAGPPS